MARIPGWLGTAGVLTVVVGGRFTAWWTYPMQSNLRPDTAAARG